jgi:hypothetical protein
MFVPVQVVVYSNAQVFGRRYHALVVRTMSPYQCINTFVAVLCSASEYELHSAESSDIRPFLTEEFSFIVR